MTAPSIALRDRVAAVYNKMGFLNNGDKVLIVERSANKRFVHVRTSDNKEGWIPQRYLVGQDVFDGFARLAREASGSTSQAIAVTRRIVNMHVRPAREADALFQLKEGEKLQLLKRKSSPKVEVKAPPVKPEVAEDEKEKDKAKESEEEEPQPASQLPKRRSKVVKRVTAPSVPMEDWWLVRDPQKRVGWVLGRMLDVEIPLEIAQYAEGQRIVATHVMSEVPSGRDNNKMVPQYLVLMSENKDGLPFDFNQVRVFTWNQRKSRYETAFRERFEGELPLRTGMESFGKEGTLPYFVLNSRSFDGNLVERKYKMNGVMVRRVSPEGNQVLPRRTK